MARTDKTSNAWSRKTKAQLVAELEMLQRRVAALENAAGTGAPAADAAYQFETFRYVTEHLPFYLAWKDRDLVYLGCNLNQARAVGLTDPAEIVGKTDFDLPWTNEEAELYREGDRKVIETGEPLINREATQHRADGRVSNILTSKVPLRDDKGRIVGVISLFADISERKQAEAALRESESRLRDIIDGSIQGIIVTRGIEPIFANQSYADIFGYDSPEAVMALEDEASLVAPEERERLRRYAEARDKGREAPSEYEFQGTRKDGTRIWISNRVRMVNWWDGRAILSTVSDVTERRRAEAELERAHEELESRVEERTAELSRANRQLEEEVAQRQRAEEAIRESETRLRTITDATPIPVFITRLADSKYLYVNEALGRLMGLAVTDIVGRTARDFYADQADRELYVEQLKKQGNVRDYEMKLRTPAGTFIATINSSQIIVFDGEPAILGGFYDITERKAMEERLRESESKFRNLIEGSLQGVLVFSADRRLLFANPSGARIFGYDSAEEIMAVESTERLYAPRELERLDRYRVARIAGETVPAEVEFEGRRKDGSAIFLRAMPHVVEWDGEIAVQAAILDITESREAEQALRTSEERAARARQQLYEAIESIPDGFVLFDANERLTLSNEKCKELYPMIADMFVPGVTLEDLTRAGIQRGQFALSDSDAEDWLRERLRQFRSSQGVYEQQLSDGRWVLASDRKTPEGAIVGIRTDITERKRHEETLRQAQKMEAVGQLTGGVAHDFNNLLTIILGNLELLDEAAGDDQTTQDLVGPAQGAARRGAELTQRLLAFSRKQTLQPKTIDLRRLILGMGDMIRRTLGESIEVRIVSADEPWQTVADPGQVESALLNLAINARDAMPGGGVLTIDTGAVTLDQAYAAEHADAATGDFVVMSVTDTGGGMTPEVLERACDPFFTTKDVGQGTGLGLSMVYGFVRQSGGHTRIFSEPGKGTTVRLYLPRPSGDADPAGDSSEFEAPPAGDETILLVEDDDALRELAVKMLTGLGYEVVAAENGRAALALLDDTPAVDILLTDVILPEGMNGREFAEESLRRRPGIKVLYMSGYAESLLATRGTLDPSTTLLKKPFMRMELAQTLRAVLDRREN